MAGDLARAVAVCDTAVDVASRVGIPADASSVAEHVTADLTRRDDGDQRDLVIAAAGTWYDLAVARLRDDLIAAHRRRNAIDPMTAVAITDLGRAAQKRLAVAQTERDHLDDHLAHAWDTTVAATTHFDDEVAAHDGHVDAYALGWALIGTEGAKHVRLIWQQANKLHLTYSHVSPDDMLSWGWIGLRTALRHFNPDLGFRFSTYAATRITGTIRDGLRSEQPIPKRLGTFARKVAAAEELLTQQLGRTPTLVEVSAHLDADLDQIVLAQRAVPESSLQDILESAGEWGAVPDFMIDPTDTADAGIGNVIGDAVARALATLDPDDAAAVRLLVMDELHPTDARRLTGATARQMRQRKERALAVLREALADWE